MTEELIKQMEYSSDIQAIRQLFGRYLYMLMSMDFENIYESCFSKREDTSINGLFTGKDIHETFFLKIMGALKKTPGAFTMHLATEPVIEIGDGRKTARSVVMSPGCATDAQTGEPLWIWGTFTDDYVREDGKWKILHHSFIPLFRTPYDKSWVKPAEEILGGMAQKPSQSYDPSKPGGEIFAVLPTVAELKIQDF